MGGGINERTYLSSSAFSTLRWHHKLGHPKSHLLSHLATQYKLPFSSSFSDCLTCSCNKSHQLPFSSSSFSTSRPLECVFVDTSDSNDSTITLPAPYVPSPTLSNTECLTDTIHLPDLHNSTPTVSPIVTNSEYGSWGIISTKGDVYSYGILMLEMFTRKKPTDEMFTAELNLKRWITDLMPNVAQIVDSNLLQIEGQQIDGIITYTTTILELALRCCADLQEARVSMMDVVASLNKIKMVLM
ncbi:hypothetical protein L6164_037446 [Bauhinia variegata]|uniref:Uncharacterized protein n=1 Tax=Bauhinia variegata TaxID=167791 RepID=A0ACB9KK21_BAUVA|nr:hypothetical protein L6164_037446 [Bauhinia variegata]